MKRAVATQRRAAKLGNGVERLVEAQNDAMALAGVAYLCRVPTPTALRRTKAGLLAVHTRAATVDFLGHDRRARAVAVEVKHVAARPALKSGADAAWTFPLSRVEPPQRRALDALTAAGGIAVLLIVYDRGRSLFAVPWRLARPLESLTRRGLEEHRVPAGAFYLTSFLSR